MARPGAPAHRAPATRIEVRTVRRLVATFVVIGVALPTLASAAAGSGSKRGAHAGVTTADGSTTYAQRFDSNAPPADRGDRLSPTAGQFSAAESPPADESAIASTSIVSAPPFSSALTPSAFGSPLLAPLLNPGFTPTPAPAPVPTPAPTHAAGPTHATVPSVAAAPVTKSSSPAAVAPVKTAKPPPPAAPYVPAAAGYPFSSSSVWRQSVATAAVASNSSTLVGTLAGQVSSVYKGVAAFNVGSYNTTFYTVGASAPRADVIWDDCQNRGWEVDGLEEQFAQVPIPSNAVPADGTDAELTVYSPSSDQLWEFWQANHQSDGWHACFGGRIDHVSSSPGYFTGGFGATATGLPVAGGMISIADAKAGVISHAMSLVIMDPAPWNDFSYPAQRSDGGNNSPSAIPEGTRFRLDPSINVNALDLTPLAKMIAKAAQQYGFIVTDQGGAVGVQTENAASAGSDPWPGLMGSVPSYEILANFPWSQMQALPKNWGE